MRAIRGRPKLAITTPIYWTRPWRTLSGTAATSKSCRRRICQGVFRLAPSSDIHQTAGRYDPSGPDGSRSSISLDGVLSVTHTSKTRKERVAISAAANFAGRGVLGTVGVMTLTKIKHRRALRFSSSAPVHQAFAWLGLDGALSPIVAHDMRAAFRLTRRAFSHFSCPSAFYRSSPIAIAAGGCCRAASWVFRP